MPIKELKVLTDFSVPVHISREAVRNPVDHTEQESNCNVYSHINTLLKILVVSCMKLGRGIFWKKIACYLKIHSANSSFV